MKRRDSSHGRKSGFTLMEILLVLGLMAILIAFLADRFTGVFDGGLEDITRMRVKDSLSQPLFSFKKDMGRYPTTEQGLNALLNNPSSGSTRWRGPYVKNGDAFLDAWDQPLVYKYPGVKNPTGYDLYSLGKDGVESADDLGNW